MSRHSDQKHPRRPWRENIEALTMAIIMAVMLKYFLVEAYKIPTGSMQPTLMGNSETGIFDRILVDKLSYHFRDPQRWEVAVFKYPLDRSKSFIKRIVGMPGEQLLIEHGDLFTRAAETDAWSILRRPRSVQRSVWKRLDPVDPRYERWSPVEGARTWKLDGRERIEARGTGAVRLPNDNRSVIDNYRDGYPSTMGSLLKRGMDIVDKYPVPDLRLRGEITALPGCVRVVIELRENEQVHRFELPGPAAPEDARPRVSSEDAAGGGARLDHVADEPWRLPAGEAIGFAARNLDDELLLEVDGRPELALEVPASTPGKSADVPGSTEGKSSFTVRVEGEGADLEDLVLERDIYYTRTLSGRVLFRIPAGQYVMLGDNTQDSSDSREWRFARFRWDGPGSDGEWVRGNLFRTDGPNQRDLLNGNPTEVPGELGGPRIFFRDEWGDRHTFLSQPGMYGATEDAPFVARNLIVGRAVVVFWPQTPLWPGNWGDSSVPNVWRLKWIR